MSRKKLLFFHVLIASAIVSAFTACDKVDVETKKPAKEQFVMGQPVQLDFSVPNENSITRTSTLSTDKTVFVTVDEGQQTWYAYQYNTSTHLWEAKKVYNYDSTTEKWVMSTNTKGITWTSNTMLIYAVVRNDSHPTAAEETAGESPITQPIQLPSDQSTIANLTNASVYGSAERVEFTTGRVEMTLKYIVAKTLVKVSNCESPNAWTCTTAKSGDVKTEPTAISPGIYFLYYTQGKIKIGNDKVTFEEQDNSSNISMFRQNANVSNKTVEFVSYIIPIDGVICAAFTLTNGTITNLAINTNSGGLTFLGGYTTTINVVIQYPQ